MPEYHALERFSERVERASGGRFIITPYSAGSITSGSMMWEAVRDGVIEMGQGWTCWWVGKTADYGDAHRALVGSPWMLGNIVESMAWWYEDDGLEILNKWYNPMNILYRPAWWLGSDMGMLTTFEATSLDDFAGKRFRSCPALYVFTEAAVADAGYVSTYDPVVPEEIFESLAKGLLDACEWTVPSACWAAKWHEYCTHLIVPGIWGGPAQTGDFIIGLDAYNALPADLQEILEAEIRYFNLDQTLSGQVLDAEAMVHLAEYGIIINTWSDEDMVHWMNGAAKLHEEYYTALPAYAEVYESLLSFKLKMQQFGATQGARYYDRHDQDRVAFWPPGFEKPDWYTEAHPTW